MICNQDAQARRGFESLHWLIKDQFVKPPSVLLAAFHLYTYLPENDQMCSDL
jgi:hypothetical protein